MKKKSDIKIYEFYWSWHEDYNPILFSHLKNKSKNEFKKDCIKALKTIGDKYLSEESCWVGAHHWIEKAIEKLIEFGYKEISSISFGHFGSYIIKNDNEEDTIFKKIVGKKLFNRAVEHNKKLEKELNLK